MGRESINLEVLSTRDGFNSAVKYMNKTLEISGDLDANNLGDLLYERGDENLSGDRSAALLRMLLVGKLGYKSLSVNLASVAADVASLAAVFESWKAVDMVAAYHHPDLGLLLANPKVAEELGDLGMLRKNELLVLYVGKGSSPADETCQKAAELAVSFFEGKKAKVPPEFLKGNFSPRKLKKAESGDDSGKKAKTPGRAKAGKPEKTGKAAPKPRQEKKAAAPAPKESVRVAPPVVTAAAPAVSKGPVRMTPMYSVVVSNELFHNGNVEAWKRIVKSYNVKYPELQVYIYYEGERILDINSLFKWGKVKHGSAIQFAVSGSEIKDVAKLQRYLVQGASNQFEAFLHGPVNNVLRLFG